MFRKNNLEKLNYLSVLHIYHLTISIIKLANQHETKIGKISVLWKQDCVIALFSQLKSIVRHLLHQ